MQQQQQQLNTLQKMQLQRSQGLSDAKDMLRPWDQDCSADARSPMLRHLPYVKRSVQAPLDVKVRFVQGSGARQVVGSSNGIVASQIVQA
jgi:hypothetical protein